MKPRALCLAFRERKGRLEVLLINSRKHGEWRIPGLKVPKRRLPRETAAVAGFRQAGVTGALSANSIGRLQSGKKARTALVFGLQVSEIHRDWRRRKIRRKWFTLQKAARRVRDPQTAAVILGLEQLVPDARGTS